MMEMILSKKSVGPGIESETIARKANTQPTELGPIVNFPKMLVKCHQERENAIYTPLRLQAR